MSQPEPHPVPADLKPVADVLTMLAAETQDLAHIAQILDSTICAMPAPAPGTPGLSELQRVDALCQHLEDVTRILTKVSKMIGPGPVLDIHELALVPVLDDFRRKLRSPDAARIAAPSDGHVVLF